MREEGDFIDQLAHLFFYDEHNPVREWMEYGRSNPAPVLDEEDGDGDVPLSSHLVRDHIHPTGLRDDMGDDCISNWAHRNVGDTHLGKRKLQKGVTMGDLKRRRGKGKVAKISEQRHLH
jgi:L-ascorbate metabolism protein UlaG (beta-lactamase superfamily)